MVSFRLRFFLAVKTRRLRELPLPTRRRWRLLEDRGLAPAFS